MSLLAVRDLGVAFRTRRGRVAALSGVDLDVDAGTFQVVVGESGSGKSVLAHALLGLLPRNVEIHGSATLHGAPLLAVPESTLRALRARRIAFIPQSPATALNPVRRVGSLLVEGARVKGVPARAVRSRLEEATAALGLDLDDIFHRYAHQLSGGMQQRVLTALALVGEPDLVIADEPTSGLDADRVADTAKQLRGLADAGAGLMVITHDLGLAAELGGRLALLYAGRVVEERPTDAFLSAPAHPYGTGLLGALPQRGGRPIPGLPPALTDMPPGCAFAPRCPQAWAACAAAVPPAYALVDGTARCVLHAPG